MIIVAKYSKEEWAPVSEAAHKIAFAELKDSQMDRIDFALVAIKDERPMGYVTCREQDAETLYWQFGGAFPGTKDTRLSWAGYQEFVEWCRRQGYKRITTLIENDNIVMLKMAMKVGFRICGVRYYRGILVEHVLEFADEV